jgi:hypothetical protein
MSENIYNPDGKDIRFIDSEYNTLFTVPDGGAIVVTRENGEQRVGICKYIDNTHFSVNGNCYHIHQFAAQTERNGSKVEIEK